MVRWLKERLGFAGYDPDSWRVPYVDLRRDGLRLKIMNCREIERARPLPKGSIAGPVEYSFPVDGLREFRAELESRRTQCTEIREDGPGRHCFLIEDPERNQWKFWQRQRAMKSRPSPKGGPSN